MKGILLTGGSGTRLYPTTLGISKQLLPIYNKPTFYYPMSVLMLAGVKDIIFVTNYPKEYENFFGDGSSLGLNLNYVEQKEPLGLAHPFILAEDYIKNHKVCMALGDNIFYGHGLENSLIDARNKTEKGACVFGYHVNDPQRYGVANLDSAGNVLEILEKPINPPSNIAVTGLYFYDEKVVGYAKKIKPSARGELEITDLNNLYLQDKNLSIEILQRGIAWFDTGTPESLLQAGNFVEAIEQRQNLKIACLEEVAYRKGFINLQQLENLGLKQAKSEYGKYILGIVKSESKKMHDRGASNY